MGEVESTGVIPSYDLVKQWILEDFTNYKNHKIRVLGEAIMFKGSIPRPKLVTLWQSMNRVLDHIKHYRGVQRLKNTEEIMTAWKKYLEDNNLPSLTKLREYCEYLDKAIYASGLVTLEEIPNYVDFAYS